MSDERTFSINAYEAEYIYTNIELPLEIVHEMYERRANSNVCVTTGDFYIIIRDVLNEYYSPLEQILMGFHD